MTLAPRSIRLLAGTVSVFLASTVAASALDVRLALAGDEFKGLPRFELRAGDRLVASEEVSAARDADPQVFSFDVPDDTARLSLAFVNDAYEKDVGDRNLIVRSFSVNGVEFPASAFTTDREGKPAFGMSRRATLTLDRPAEGWPSAAPEAPAAEVAAAPEVSEPAAPAPADDNQPQAVAAVEPPPVSCGATEVVLSFGLGGFQSSDSVEAALAGLQNRDACRFRVEGFTDPTGPSGQNQRLSEARARWAADRLAEAGIAEDRIEAIGSGETDRFGAPAENRRVVITISD